MSRVLRIAACLLLIASVAWAQGWRGQGRVGGRVTDEARKPIEGVVVKLALPSEKGAMEVKTNSKGDWSAGGIARGDWQIDFSKPGYEARHISVPVSEITRIPPIETVLKKAEDPNEIIAGEMKRANELLTEKKYAEARAVYEALLARYPQAYRIEQSVARTYYLEGKPELAIDRLKSVLAKDPEAIELKLLLGSLLLEMGRADEGKQVLSSVDDSKITEAAIYVNFGIAMMNKGQGAEAFTYFDKAIARFPQEPDAYYYRGITQLQLSGVQGDEAQKADRLQKAKADLTKFIQMAPNAPEAENAKKILEQLK
jgi:tetratricopeptide (TPR) repeat protein